MHCKEKGVKEQQFNKKVKMNTEQKICKELEALSIAIK